MSYASCSTCCTSTTASGLRQIILKGSRTRALVCKLIKSVSKKLPLDKSTTALFQLLLFILDHFVQWTFLNHETHDLIQGICGRHSGMLCVRVIGRSHFNDVRSNQIDAFKSTDDRAKFASRPSSSFWGSCRWRDFIIMLVTDDIGKQSRFTYKLDLGYQCPRRDRQAVLFLRGP